MMPFIENHMQVLLTPFGSPGNAFALPSSFADRRHKINEKHWHQIQLNGQSSGTNSRFVSTQKRQSYYCCFDDAVAGHANLQTL